MKTHLQLAVTFLIFFCTTQSISSQSIVFIYDASGSMWGQIEGETKSSIAAQVLNLTLKNLDEGQQVGLVAYGHRREADCSDVEVLVKSENSDRSAVSSAIAGIKPLGRTPLADAVSKVIDQLKADNHKATIILITDGVESCGGDLCAVVRKAKEAGIEFKLHIVGFDLGEVSMDNLKCAAEAGSGKFYEASDADELYGSLQSATSDKVEDPPGNVRIYASKNGEAIDAWVKIYKGDSKDQVANSRTYQDTSTFYAPEGVYTMVVQPLSGSDVTAQTVNDFQVFGDSITFNEISFDSGTLTVASHNNNELWDAVVNVYTPEGNRVSGNRTYGRARSFDLDPGIYDVEFKILRVKGPDIEKIIKGIPITAKTNYDLNCNFESGIVRIGAFSGNELVDAWFSITHKDLNKKYSGGRTYTSPSSNPKEFQLTPGIYFVSLKALGPHKGKVEKFEIEVKAGELTERVVEFE
ncbi:MAG: VWA domain-containing protein [Saprospiraceae bacterium]|nr:VWA domain-containing protein [Saprospiraceae bacterium]